MITAFLTALGLFVAVLFVILAGTFARNAYECLRDFFNPKDVAFHESLAITIAVTQVFGVLICSGLALLAVGAALHW